MMDGVRKVEWLDPDGNIHVSLTQEVDLDDLMLELAKEADAEHWLFDMEDRPTKISGAVGELEVGRYRSNPCNCGDQHRYDIAEAHGKGLRGSYLGLMGRDYLPAPTVLTMGQQSISPLFLEALT